MSISDYIGNYYLTLWGYKEITAPSILQCICRQKLIDIFPTRWLSFEYQHVHQLHFLMPKVGLGGLNSKSYTKYIHFLQLTSVDFIGAMCVISINILVNLFLYEIKELKEYKNQGQEVQFILLVAHEVIVYLRTLIKGR